MIKKQSTALICVLAFLISAVPAFAQAAGVTGFASRRVNTNLILTWTNPSDFESNTLYIEKNGEAEESVELGNARQYTYAPIENGDSLIFTIRTSYSDGSFAEESLRYYARYNDTESIDGWTVQISDVPDFGITSEDSADGSFSVYFNREGETADNIYRLLRYGIVEKDKSYRIGFWFKTSGYEDGSSFKYDDIETGGQKEIVIGGEYPDGEWYHIEQEFTAAAAGSKAAAVNIYSKGKIYIDKFTFEEIDASGNVINVLFDDTFEEDLGVGNLTAVRNGSVAELSWTNPLAEGFLYNEVYKVYNDKKTLLAELREGETSYNAAINAGGGYKFIIRSCYDGGIYGETETEFWRNLTDTSIIPGWSIDVCDINTYKFRGDYGITKKEAYDGQYSAYFTFNHAVESNVYLALFRDISLEAGKKYCFSYWFKTEDYDENGGGRIMIQDHALGDRQKITVGADEYPNGEWHNVRYFYDSPSASTKRIQIWFDSFGTLYLDNLEVYEVDENNQRIGENLIVGSDSKTDGSFESESFSQKPGKPADAVLTPLFRGFDTSWAVEEGAADKIRVYNGEEMLSECSYADGKVTVRGLPFGDYELDICSVSAYGVESDKVKLIGKTLSYSVTDPEFSRGTIAKGNISTKLKAANDGEEELNVTLIAALYNKNKLEKIDFVKAVLKTGEEKELTVDIEVPELAGGEYSVAAYAWDDFFAAGKAYGKAQWL